MNRFLKLNKDWIKFQVSVTALIIILLSAIVRFTNQGFTPIGYETYTYQKIAEQVMNYFVYGAQIENISYLFNPFYLLLSLINLTGKLNLLVNILPGIITIIIVYLLVDFLEKINLDSEEIFLTMLIFFISPIFVHYSITLSVYSFILMLGLAGINLLDKYKVLAGLLFLFAGLSSLYGGIALSILLISYYFYNKDKKILKYSGIVFLAAIISMQKLSFNFVSSNIIQEFIGDLGGLTGFNIYTLALAFIGISILWKIKYKLFFVYTGMLSIWIMGLILEPGLNLYIMIPVSIFAMYGLIHITNRNWSSDLIRDLTLIVLFAGILTSGISYLELNREALPHYDVQESLLTLRYYAGGEGIVLSTYDKSEWIESLSGLKVYADYDKPHLMEINNIFYTRNFNNLINFLKDNNIRYIWIDQDLKDKYWPNNEYGLPYLLKNTENFDLIYDSPEVKLWKFIGYENDVQ